MRNSLTITMAAVILTVGLSPAASAQDRSFACEQIAARYERDQIKRIAHNREMEVIVKEYMWRWDARHIRSQCQAFSNGAPNEISCLNGKRDWNAIKASIPSEYSRMDRKSLRPFMEMERDKENGRDEAVTFCRDVGAIPVWRE